MHMVKKDIKNYMQLYVSLSPPVPATSSASLPG